MSPEIGLEGIAQALRDCVAWFDAYESDDTKAVWTNAKRALEAWDAAYEDAS